MTPPHNRVTLPDPTKRAPVPVTFLLTWEEHPESSYYTLKAGMYQVRVFYRPVEHSPNPWFVLFVSPRGAQEYRRGDLEAALTTGENLIQSAAYARGPYQGI